MSDYLWDPSCTPDPEVTALEEQLAELRAPLPPLPALPPRVAPTSAAGGEVAGGAPPRSGGAPAFPWLRWGLLAAAGLLLAFVFAPREELGPPPTPGQSVAPGRGWRVVARAGTPRVGSAPLSGEGRWETGQWLVTGPGDEVEVEVAEIGELRLAPSSRLRLAQTGPDQHRLLLEVGSFSAKVTAPPRLFLVDTPRGRASDLGCAYTLTVDPEGKTSLVVTSGAVELAGATAFAFVPAGARCVSNAEGAPGTPVQLTASEDFQAALSDLDQSWWDQGALAEAPLDAVLALAAPGDGLSLWHLIPRALGPARQRVIVGLARLTPLPFGVRMADAERLDPKALQRWREAAPWGAWRSSGGKSGRR